EGDGLEGPLMREVWLCQPKGGQAGRKGDDEARADICLGRREDELRQRNAATRNCVNGDAGRSDKSADEAAARLIVASQQDVDRENERRRQDEPAGRTKDHRVHWRSSCFARRIPASTAAAAIAARPRTTISPSVSMARKSTRMTLTRLRPWASGTAVSRKNTERRSSKGCASTLNISSEATRPMLMATHRSRL